MTITITEKEFDAIRAVLDQVETDYEASSDPDYLKTMGEFIDHVKNVLRKYKAARVKAREFQRLRAIVAEKTRGRCVLARDIDKLTRQWIKEIKEMKKNKDTKYDL